MTDFKRHPDTNFKDAIRINPMTAPVVLIVIAGGLWLGGIMAAWLG